MVIHFWPESVSGRQELTVGAFKALEAKKYELAVSKAEEVIGEFAGIASDRQKKLENEKAQEPPIGKLTDEQKAALFQEGLLNDVAACYFIKGRALEHLRRNTEARTNYEAAAKLTYARTYSPDEDIFWSPADGAKGRLNTLPK